MKLRVGLSREAPTWKQRRSLDGCHVSRRARELIVKNTEREYRRGCDRANAPEREMTNGRRWMICAGPGWVLSN
jgi:hypothetical protein